jgi:hypothetical protein
VHTHQTLLRVAIVVASLSFPSLTIATSPDLGKTPQVLLLHRVDLPAGRVADYAEKESEIVQAYQNAGIPVYWVTLQSVTGPPHFLYFDGYNAFEEVEAAGAAISKAAQSHPDLSRLQSELMQFAQASQASIHLRREDLSYRLDKFDITKFRYVRITIFQLRSGYEQDFADALRTFRKAYEATGSESPWAVFQAHSGMPAPTFIAVQLLTSLKEFDDALEARKYEHENPFDFGHSKPQLLPKDAILSMESNLYSVNLNISHLPIPNSARLSNPSMAGENLYPHAVERNPISGNTIESYQQGRN